MNENTHNLREPTVDDLRVKLCYICREEERYDSTLSQSPCNAYTNLSLRPT